MAAVTAAERRRALRRGADLERTAAAALGSKRTATIGSRRREPDVAPITLGCGLLLQAECKARKRLPSVLVAGFEQALLYEPRAVPLVVLRAPGHPALAVLALEVFAQIAGIDRAAFPTRHRPTKRCERQLELNLVTA